ncbi:protein kinase [Myxococcus sp. MISCRS1]|uniref:serine/threonine-protein kinase n=1 Tax=Myxococcus sp. MISCRS1 TaxID=2996786 RepID=UPI00226E7521|nr:serine/threonine-protein kinase [Myxococcus sp. MISCRS1]MCY0998708.1 protein kinase [Myxococcus sp. MISCRS1]
MGTVFLARHLRLPGRHVAVKVLRHDASLGEEVYLRFRREAEIASRLGHPNIVEVIDFDTLADGSPFLVMEHLKGMPLSRRIRKGAQLTLPEVFSIARQMGSALQAAHGAGVVHRDLKPGNVFLVPTELGGMSVEHVKLLDFGISKIIDSKTVQTQDAILLGTPQYMAPEQATGKNREVDPRTDIFSFGCMVYEMLARKLPFKDGGILPELIYRIVYDPPEPLLEVAPQTPVHVVRAIEQALAKRPEDRFPDVSAFIAALTGTPLRTATPSPDAPAPVVVRPAAQVPTATVQPRPIASPPSKPATQVVSPWRASRPQADAASRAKPAEAPREEVSSRAVLEGTGHAPNGVAASAHGTGRGANGADASARSAQGAGRDENGADASARSAHGTGRDANGADASARSAQGAGLVGRAANGAEAHGTGRDANGADASARSAQGAGLVGRAANGAEAHGTGRDANGAEAPARAPLGAVVHGGDGSTRPARGVAAQAARASSDAERGSAGQDVDNPSVDPSRAPASGLVGKSVRVSPPKPGVVARPPVAEPSPPPELPRPPVPDTPAVPLEVWRPPAANAPAVEPDSDSEPVTIRSPSGGVPVVGRRRYARWLLAAGVVALVGAGLVATHKNRSTTPVPLATTPTQNAPPPEVAPAAPAPESQTRLVQGTPPAEKNTLAPLPPPTGIGQMESSVVPSPEAKAKPEGQGTKPTDLELAEKALARGDPGEAIQLARRSQRDQATGASFALLARAHCHQKDLSSARFVWLRVPASEQAEVRRYCQQHGITL